MCQKGSEYSSKAIILKRDTKGESDFLLESDNGFVLALKAGWKASIGKQQKCMHNSEPWSYYNRYR